MGHMYHLHIDFPDGALVHALVAAGWAFTVSLFTFKRNGGRITVFPAGAVTRIQTRCAFVTELRSYATASGCFLTFHCLIARSWLMAGELGPDDAEREMANKAREMESRAKVVDQHLHVVCYFLYRPR